MRMILGASHCLAGVLHEKNISKEPKDSQTTPPLTPMMPSTNQHIETANSVAFVVSSHDPGLVALLGIGKAMLGGDASEEKADDKGKVTPRRMIYSRAT